MEVCVVMPPIITHIPHKSVLVGIRREAEDYMEELLQLEAAAMTRSPGVYTIDMK